MAEPVLGVSLEADEGLGAALCGKPVVGMLFSGLQSNVGQAMAAEAFQQALNMGDLNRALDLLELYAQPCSQEGALRDKLLACTALQGKIYLGDTVSGTVFTLGLTSFTIKSDINRQKLHILELKKKSQNVHILDVKF